MVNSTLPEEIQSDILADEFFGLLIPRIQSLEKQKSLEDYELKEGLLLFKGRLCILRTLQVRILNEAHESPLAAHRGY